MTPLTQEWVQKAEADFETVRWVMQAPTPSTDAICFHAHACIEKYLKARLQEAAIPFPKTHDLEMLLNLALAVEPGWGFMLADLKLLNRFAIEYRYPGVTATLNDAQEAFQKCAPLRQTMRASLGLPQS